MTPQARELGIVVGIGVAIRAVVPLASVSAGVNREVVGVVLEACAGPGSGGVAGGAIGWEAGGSVIWIGCVVVVGLVAAVAGGWLSVVDAVGVAGVARQVLVRAGQREIGGVVIEVGIPVGGGVALLAVGGEARRPMIGVGGGVVVASVTAIAIGRFAVVDTVSVTGVARLVSVCAGKREVGAVVVEASAIPTRGGVALRTVGAEPCCSVIGVGGRIVLRLVAAIARGRLAVVDTIGMTGRARLISVCAGQREVGGVVIEIGIPVGGGMALLAVGGEAGRSVIGVGGGVVVRPVATVAIGRFAVVHAVGVTGVARLVSVCAGKREVGSRVIEVGAIPTRGGVTLRAVGAEPCCSVIGVGGRIVLRLVAAIARC